MRPSGRIIVCDYVITMNTHHTLIAEQGKPFIIMAFIIVCVVTYYLGWLLSAPFWLLVGILVYLFRDPQREVPAEPLDVVSPADGRITAIDTVRDNYLDRDAIRIRLRMNPLGVYTTRSPTEGKVMQQWYITDRAQLRAGDPAFAQWMQTDEGDDVILALHPGVFRQRPSCYVQSGERIGQGQRCGFISFGAVIEIFIPANAVMYIQPGQTVFAGSTSLARLAG
jgi:phosphatidylserine decarboxylase